jgi:hypothetical protein
MSFCLGKLWMRRAWAWSHDLGLEVEKFLNTEFFSLKIKLNCS